MDGRDEYSAALDRLLDGLDPVSDSPEASQAAADVAAISRALGLIGGALAADEASEGGGTATGAAAGGAAAGAVPTDVPTDPDEVGGGATVVAMSSWRRKLNPRVLSAAAVGLLVLGIGIPVATSVGGGSSDSDSYTAGDASQAISQPESAAADAGLALDSAPDVEAFSGGTDGAIIPGAAPGAPASTGATTGNAAGTAAKSGTATNSAPAPAAAADAAGGAAKRTSKLKAADTAFAQAVACARAVVIGQVTAVQAVPGSSRVKVTLLVTEWIVPASGPALVTYEVGGAVTNPENETVAPGQRRLFIVPGPTSERLYAYPEAQWPQTRDRISAVRAERAGEGCS